MTIKVITVDNYTIASILNVSSNINSKILTPEINNQEYQYLFLPLDIVNENVTQYPLDTYGILNKKKLLFREPITGEQISYVYAKKHFEIATEQSEHTIETLSSKLFYLYEIKNISHKYKNSIFTNLKSKNVNIIFPNSSTIHIISDDITNLKKYVKILSGMMPNDNFICKIKIPKELSVNKNGKIVNNITINNDTYLGMTYQISQILKISLNDIKTTVTASENDNNYINKIFFTFYNFIPNFITPFLFKFLLRLNKSKKFSNQVLEIDNFYNFENYFFTNSIDDELSIGSFSKGKFLPKVNIIGKNKDLKGMLKSKVSIICSSDLNIKSKNDIIYLKTSSNKSQAGYRISKSSYELLNLENYYYEVATTGLILMADINKNINKKNLTYSAKSKYSDDKQKSLDSFDAKSYKPTLPKLPKPRISFNWPIRAKKQ